MASSKFAVQFGPGAPAFVSPPARIGSAFADALNGYKNRLHLSALRAVQVERDRSIGITAMARRAVRSAGRCAEIAASRAAAGLVSVSTTLNSISVPEFRAAHVLEIDRAQARVTRLRKGLGVGAKQLHNMGSLKQRIWMQTLTYSGDNRDWRPEHISQYVAQLRRWHASRTGSAAVRYAWVAELQKRGVIHYHVIVWLEGGLTPPKADKAWVFKSKRLGNSVQAPMWPHGMTNRLKSTAPVAYLMKYASKVEQKNVGNFPYGARIHGMGGMDKTGRSIRRWVLWPSYVQKNADVSDVFRPAPGGGFVNAETGELLRSDWMPSGGGFSSFIRIRKGPTRIDASGPFSWWGEQGAVLLD